MSKVHYLTNISSDKALLVDLAACLCETSVVAYDPEPMPVYDAYGNATGEYPQVYATYRAEAVRAGKTGCIVGYNDTFDYSDFWEVYNRLEKDGLDSFCDVEGVTYLFPFHFPEDSSPEKVKWVKAAIAALQALVRE